MIVRHAVPKQSRGKAATVRLLSLARNNVCFAPQADFVEGQVLFTEANPKPPDLRHLQAAMFLDRPDLWPGKRRFKCQACGKWLAKAF